MDTHQLQASREGRSEERKIFRTSGTLFQRGHAPLPIKTLDISTMGIGVMSPEAVREGTTCGIDFSGFAGDRKLHVQVMARVVYCICVGTTGFRLGFQFTDVPPDMRVAINQLVA